MADENVNQQLALKQRYVKKSDLPLHCPTPDMELWSSHPRVYLKIEATGTTVCPYCNREYLLDNN